MTCCGLTENAIQYNDQKLEAAQQFSDYETMLFACPSTKLPSAQRSELLAANQDPAAQQAEGGAPQPQEAASPEQQAQSSSDLQTAQTMYLEPQIEQNYQQFNDLAEKQLQSKPVKGQAPDPKSKTQQLRNMVRGNQEWMQRRNAAESYALSQWATNNRATEFIPFENLDSSPAVVREGVMRPMWIEDNLILARQVERTDQQVIQCCWLNWEKLEEALRNEIKDLLPEVQFEPIRNPESMVLGRALATLPVQLVVDSPKLMASLDMGPMPTQNGRSATGLGMSLVIAWCGLAFAAIASAVLLHGVLRLSERRGAFVSAVTHELRTPLTTFRMYAEMLAENMVPTAEKQQEYARTLKVESERLSHLVENVLQFARLERGSETERTENLTIDELFERFSQRLQDRAAQSEMTLKINVDGEWVQTGLRTDPAKIEQVLFNLVDNACKYARSADKKRIDVTCSGNARSIRFAVRDYGPGVSEEGKKRLFRPFCKSDQQAADSAPGVGLGLALCHRMARSLGGRLFMR